MRIQTDEQPPPAFYDGDCGECDLCNHVCDSDEAELMWSEWIDDREDDYPPAHPRCKPVEWRVPFPVWSICSKCGRIWS